MRRFLLATAIASPLFLSAPSSRAQMPVIDFAALGQWFQQIQYALQTVQQLQQQVQQAINTVHALTNIPANLAGQVVGLLQSTIQNPLQGINLNLQSLMMGSGSGVCPGAGGMLSATQGWTATGGDFLGSMMNGGATQLAGLLACTQQMMQAAQQRLTLMPQLLSELQACADVSCTTAVSGRIQLETATINTQQQQAALMGLAQQQQRWTADDLVLQKQRADLEAMLNSLPAGTIGGGFGPSTGTGVGGGVVAAAPVFNAAAACIPWHAGCP
jgi:Type IV secretion system proteins